ncbi:MAG: hypothetical protein HC814_07580 [Rhodobacteraceae bacterium]|nr:hypothetical protein [Paracoccaceae bacterium]
MRGGVKQTTVLADRKAVAGPSQDVRCYMAVLDVAKQRRSRLSPAAIAREHLGWDKARWDQAEADYWKWQQDKAEAVGAWTCVN